MLRRDEGFEFDRNPSGASQSQESRLQPSKEYRERGDIPLTALTQYPKFRIDTIIDTICQKKKARKTRTAEVQPTPSRKGSNSQIRTSGSYSGRQLPTHVQRNITP